MNMETYLRNDLKAPIRTITLARGASRNSLSTAMMRVLRGDIESAAKADGVRVIILAAEGPVFCAGHDLKEIEAERQEPDRGEAAYGILFAACVALMKAILACPVPVIAQVQGMATAAGCQLVATCDLAVAADTATFATPGVNIGLFCSTPMVALSRNVPQKSAMEMLLTGNAIDATEAKRIGLINRVVAPDQLEVETRKLAGQIVQKPGPIVRIGKEAFYRQLNMGLEDAYEYTAQVMTANLLHSDAEEGIGAFIEKRDPEWSDR